jgi:iron complex outermembrane receptor protein
VTARLQRGPLTHRIVIGAERTERDYKYDFNGFAVAPIDVFNPVHGAGLGDPLFGFSDDQRWRANALYGQGLFELRHNLTALLGGRIDASSARFSDYDTGERLGTRKDRDVTPRAGLVFNPTPASAVYGSYSTSFLPQAPTVFSPAGRNPDGFEPEVGRQVEVGYKHELLNRRLTLTVAVFRIVKENVVTPDPDDPMVSIQTGEQRSRGVEIDLAGEFLPGLQGVFNYAYTDAFVSRDNRIPVGNRLVGTPKQSGGALVTYRIGTGQLRGAGIGLSVYAASERYPTLPNNAAVMAAYARADLLLSFERGRWTVRTAVNNLFDGKHYDAHSFFIVPRAPRHVIATLSLRLTR